MLYSTESDSLSENKNQPLIDMKLQGYRVSSEQQISAAFENPSERADLEMLREAATSIYSQYLSEKVVVLYISPSPAKLLPWI